VERAIAALVSMTVSKAARISICIPVYNGERYLADAISSAQRQTLNPLEILVIDDCSSDSSLAIAQACSADDPRVRVVKNDTNMGMTSNWFRCTELADGDWVKFLFQDDLLHPTCLERLHGAMVANGAVIGFVGRNVTTERVTRANRALFESLPRTNLAAGMTGARFLAPAEVADLAIRCWRVNVLGEPTSALVRRDVFARFGPFDRDFSQLCDWEYWLRVGVNEGIWFDSEALATFRIHPAAASITNRQDATWLHHGEPALLGWRFLTSENFAAVRAAASASDPPVDLEQRVARLMFRFRVEARRSGQTAGSELLTELESAFRELPRVDALHRVSSRLPTRVRRWLGYLRRQSRGPARL